MGRAVEFRSGSAARRCSYSEGFSSSRNGSEAIVSESLVEEDEEEDAEGKAKMVLVVYDCRGGCARACRWSSNLTTKAAFFADCSGMLSEVGMSVEIIVAMILAIVGIATDDN